MQLLFAYKLNILANGGGGGGVSHEPKTCGRMSGYHSCFEGKVGEGGGQPHPTTKSIGYKPESMKCCLPSPTHSKVSTIGAY